MILQTEGKNVDEKRDDISALNEAKETAPGVKREENKGLLSSELKRLAAELGEREIKFKELVQTTRGRGYDLLLV
ncbi:MAG: hypothetical protein ACP5K7_14735, partial [Verrucomicrobiia bacterium]